MGVWIEVGAKVLAYGATLLVIGAAVTRLWLLPRVAAADSSARRAAEAALASLQVGAALVLLAALLVRAFGHTVAAFDLPDALQPDNLRLIAFESQWGGSWKRQVLAAGLLLLASIWLRLERSRMAALMAGAMALVTAEALTLTGHAASYPYGSLVHGFHIVAAGAWAGTIAAVLALTAPAVRHLRSPLLHAFAPVAMGAVAIVLASGLFATWRYLGALSNLWTTTYGIALLIKVVFVGDMLVLGAINWRRLRAGGGGEAVPVTAWIEVAVASTVVLITAFLTETEHP
ncbi:MAG: copper resistance D family protein [Vicinamibacterales bacterium]